MTQLVRTGTPGSRGAFRGLAAGGVLLALLLAAPRLVQAYTYSILLDGVETEEDAYELYYEGNLSEEELERILALLQSPVDLNSADREELFELPGLTWPMVDAILAFREREGRFKKTSDLALVRELPREVLDEIRPFVEARQPWTALDYLRSRWRLQAAHNPSQLRSGSAPDGDEADGAQPQTDVPPTFYLASHNAILRWLHLGFAATEGQELAPLEYQERVPVFDDDGRTTGHRPGYLTDGMATRFDLAKIYLHTPHDRYVRWSAIAGSYRIGFGMGTVFDNSSREFPKGWKADTQLSRAEDLGRTSPVRYRDNPGLFGAAASLHRLELGSYTLSAHAFGSRIGRNTYQELYNVTEEAKQRSLYICERAPGSGACEFRRDPATGDKIHKLSTVTLLDSLTETTYGGNLNFHFDPRTQIGVTAYRGQLSYELPSAHGLELSRSSKYPDRGETFGAFGAHLFWELGSLMVRAEGAHSLGGGNAFWLRTFYDLGSLEAELGLRSYDDDYENPYTSPFAEPDEYNGNRARDERGINYVLAYRLTTGLTLKLRGDFWQTLHSQCRVEDPEEEEEAPRQEYGTSRCLELDRQQGKEVSFQPTTSTTQELGASWKASPQLRLTLRTAYTDHELSRGGRAESYSEGAGMKLSLFGKVDVTPAAWLRLTGAYRFAWVDDDGPKKIYDPPIYVASHPENPACIKEDGTPRSTSPPDCALFSDKFRQDYYFYYEISAKYKRMNAILKFKYFEEAMGYPSIAPDQGNYWVITAKIRQSKTFDLFSATLRYDVLKYVDDRAKWYEEDQREEQKGRLLLSRYNHNLTVAAEISF